MAGVSSGKDLARQAYDLGEGFYAQKNYDQAIQQYQIAVREDPRFWEAYQRSGMCYFEKGDRASALVNYQKSLDIHPDNPDLASLVQDLKEMEKGTPSSTPVEKETTVQKDSPVPTVVDNRNPNLPQKNSFIIEVGVSGWIGNPNDIYDFTGPGGSSSSSGPYGYKGGLGAAFAVSPRFQVGARYQYLKREDLHMSGEGVTLIWQEAAEGVVVEFEADIPVDREKAVNFFGSFEGGIYWLTKSSVTLSGPINGVANLNGSNGGGAVMAGVEYLVDPKKTWAMDLGVGYQFISFPSITDTPTLNGVTGSPFTLRNVTGGDARVDLSGGMLFTGARFFL